jgi:hypothetical protein
MLERVRLVKYSWPQFGFEMVLKGLTIEGGGPVEQSQKEYRYPFIRKDVLSR